MRGDRQNCHRGTHFRTMNDEKRDEPEAEADVEIEDLDVEERQPKP